MTMPSTLDLPKRLESIQALRGIAALLVLFFHLAEFQRQMASENMADIALVSGMWDRGWAGVDLFFVISGFIMVYVTREMGRSAGDVRRFMISRIMRIYPLWWVCVGIIAAYFWISYGMLAAPDRISETGNPTLYALKSFMLIPQDVLPLLGLGWTLIHEMFFYIVFAGLLFLPRKALPLAFGGWALVTLLACLFIKTAMPASNLIELIASPLSLEFIGGGLIGYAVIKGHLLRAKALLAIGGLLSVIGLYLFPYLTMTPHISARVAVFMVPFLCVTYGWVSCEIKGLLKAPRWLVKLGDWSYSLYLTHYIVLVSLRRIYRVFVPDSLDVGAVGFVDNLLFAILTLVLSLLAAAFFYNFIERPSLKAFRAVRR